MTVHLLLWEALPTAIGAFTVVMFVTTSHSALTSGERNSQTTFCNVAYIDVEASLMAKGWT